MTTRSLLEAYETQGEIRLGALAIYKLRPGDTWIYVHNNHIIVANSEYPPKVIYPDLTIEELRFGPHHQD